MSLKNLDIIFNPQRIAVIGANEDDASVGYHIFKNLIGRGFQGIVHPVNPEMRGVQGVEAYSTVVDIPHQVDLALVATDPGNMSTVFKDCRAKGVKGVIILAPDYAFRVKNPYLINERIRDLSALYGCRVLGPNSFGFLRPAIDLNASLYPRMPQQGNIAFVSESGIFSSTFLEHAISRKVGFSYFISLGAKIDINFADIIDFLGGDIATRAVFLFLRTINNGRRFMTSIRNFARRNPIMIVKPGKGDTFSCLSLSESGPPFEEDRIYDALFERAGCLRVNSILDLLYLVETIAKQKRPKGRRLMIISNSVAPSEMAMGVLRSMGGVPATPDANTLETISAGLSSRRDLLNPLYLPADASAQDYQVAIRNSQLDNGVDGVLVICIPFPGVNLQNIAATIATEAKRQPKTPVFTTWFGEETALDHIQSLRNEGIPIYFTAEHAVKSFMYMYRYDYNLKLLQETPEIIIKNFSPKLDVAKRIISNCVEESRYTLRADEAGEILRSFGIPVIDTISVGEVDEAVRTSRRIGYPVVMKVDAPVMGGVYSEESVFIHLKNDAEVRKTFTILESQLASLKDPEACVIIQPMVEKPSYELMLGAKKTLNVGTVIRFGLGGKYIMAERAYSIGLPPLNQTLARRIIEETQIYACLQGRQSQQKKRLRSLEEILVRFSQLIIDLPQMDAISINPLILMGDDCFARDVTVQLDRNLPRDYQWATGDLCPPHLSIQPYPFKYEKDVLLKNGTTIHIRPIRSEDEPELRRFFEELSQESLFLRFGQRQVNMPHDHLARFCQVDYDRDLAFLAFYGGDEEIIIGDVRLNRLPDLESAELSFVVTDQWQGRGVGGVLMDFCIVVAKEIGLKKLLMEIMKKNLRMKQFGFKYGFTPLPSSKEDDMEEFQRNIG